MSLTTTRLAEAAQKQGNAVTDDWLLPAGHSPAFLPESSALRRLPRAPRRARPGDFIGSKFESRALVYDCFWHLDGRRILLIGPPPLNLWPLVRRARYLALPSRTALQPEFHASLSVLLTELPGAPPGTTGIAIEWGDVALQLPVGANISPLLAGRRVLFTMSKDNELAWIREWAHYHAAMQGADTVILFDNGSTRYAPAEIEATLRTVSGLRHAAVISWPYRYGATDPAVMANPFYGLFLQVAAMSVVLRRYAGQAYGILNCDIDELAATPPGSTAFDLAHQARHGLAVMRGQFIEALPDPAVTHRPYLHRDFLSRRRAPAARLSRPRKWALDPTRQWIADLGVHPYMHWIEGRPWFGKTQPPGMFYWHFRGINTNWKEARTDASHLAPGDVERDEQFAALVQSPQFREA